MAADVTMTDGPLKDSVLRLADGRALAYAEWGDASGLPVLLVHGTPHSRIWCPDAEITTRAGVRLIIPDRPGFGRSDPQVGHTLDGWAADVEQLADALGLGRFGIVGWSAGGVYVAACAATIPERLTAAGIVSNRTMAVYNLGERPQALDELDDEERHVFELVRELGLEEAAKRHAVEEEEFVRGLHERPERILEGYEPPEGDQWFYADAGRAGPWFEAVRESVRQGGLGWGCEGAALMAPWSFRLADISMPVHLWYGKQERAAYHEAAEFAAETIPDARLTSWPDAGHMGVAKHWREILEAIALPARAR
jgi:pimeloyl-ACP methyl ester carboxylesterase